MGHKKLIRFEAIKSFPNVLQYPQGMAGKWAEFYKNDNPLTLELACGKGEYTVGLAKLYPRRNFLGIDVKGNRIYIGAKHSIDENLTNAAFLRSHIDKLTDYFVPGEVEEIWLTFPDPQLRKSRATRRLTYPKFIKLYQRILKPGGRIHLKTDSPVLYTFTKWVIDMYGLTLLEDSDNIYADPAALTEELKIKTHYESLDIAQSQRIHHLCFTIPDGPLPDFDAALLERIKEEEPMPPARVRPPRHVNPPRQKRGAPAQVEENPSTGTTPAGGPMTTASPGVQAQARMPATPPDQPGGLS